jgi:hypothetical protein
MNVFFEPWGFGDAVIAAAVAREVPDAVLAIKPQWQPLLSPLRIVPVSLPYTTRDRRHVWDMSNAGTLLTEPCEVLNIRGDPRDWWAAKRLFPAGRRRFNGWLQFAPHYIGLLDWKLRPVRNRYRAWAALAGIPFAQLEASYRQRQAAAPRNRRVIIHTGASRRCRQYPHCAELATLLRQRGFDPVVVTGVEQARDAALVEIFRHAEWVVANDSGPMHLAAYLGCRTLAIARVTNIHEWLPPATRFVASPWMPRGYRMDPRYNSDEVLTGWPAPAEVAAALGV